MRFFLFCSFAFFAFPLCAADEYMVIAPEQGPESPFDIEPSLGYSDAPAQPDQTRMSDEFSEE